MERAEEPIEPHSRAIDNLARAHEQRLANIKKALEQKRYSRNQRSENNSQQTAQTQDQITYPVYFNSIVCKIDETKRLPKRTKRQRKAAANKQVLDEINRALTNSLQGETISKTANNSPERETITMQPT